MIVADSSFFIAFADRKDQWHAAAKSLIPVLAGETFLITDLILAESVTIIGRRSGGKAGEQLYHYFMDTCNLAGMDEKIRTAGMQKRIMIQSFDWRTLRVVQREAPEIATVCLTAQQRWLDNVGAGSNAPSPWTAGLKFGDHGSVPRLVQAAGCRIWSAHFADLDAPKVKEAQALGLQVLAWTVNDPAQIEKVLDLGVDGIISDRPDRVREAMQRRGLALPRTAPVAP